MFLWLACEIKPCSHKKCMPDNIICVLFRTSETVIMAEIVEEYEEYEEFEEEIVDEVSGSFISH